VERFGALILDTYDFDDEEIAYQRIKEYSRSQKVILLSSESRLFKRIEAVRAEFPLAEFIERQAPVANSQVLDATEPTFHYRGSSIREEWHLIRHALESGKAPVPDDAVAGEVNNNEIDLTMSLPSRGNVIPVMISTSYHPNWRREDGGSIYPVTPFNMLTFVNQSTRLVYGRRKLDYAGLWISGGAFLVIVLGTCYGYRRRMLPSSREAIVSAPPSEPVLG
jgi:hypothetical protein